MHSIAPFVIRLLAVCRSVHLIPTYLPTYLLLVLCVVFQPAFV